MNIDHTAKIKIEGSQAVQNLKELLTKIPDHATARVIIAQGDRPWESNHNYIEFSWTEEFG